MKLKSLLIIAALVGLSACEPQPPMDSMATESSGAMSKQDCMKAAEDAKAARAEAEKAAKAAQDASDKADRIFRQGQNK